MDTQKKMLTVGELRAALEGVGDDELVTVYTNDWYYHISEVTAPGTDDGNVTVVIYADPNASFDIRFDY